MPVVVPAVVIKHLYNSDERQSSSGEEEVGDFFQDNVVNEE